jgi:hypothetical protein
MVTGIIAPRSFGIVVGGDEHGEEGEDDGDGDHGGLS